MRIIADTREQRPFPFTKYEADVERTALPTADYSLPGFEDRVGIERKELGDLVGCLMGSNRERFERELRRLSTYELKAVVIEASMRDVADGMYRSEMKPHAVAIGLRLPGALLRPLPVVRRPGRRGVHHILALGEILP
ncbi:ERCC4 domain-containing protein [Solidesulfovibrio sp.]